MCVIIIAISLELFVSQYQLHSLLLQLLIKMHRAQRHSAHS